MKRGSKMYGIISLVVLCTGAVTQASPLCPVGCDCDPSTAMVNCTNKGLTELPQNIPSNVELLGLSNNNFKSIPAGTFAIFRKLRQLDLSGNQLTTDGIEDGAFGKGDALQSLDLSSNAFKSVPVLPLNNLTFLFMMSNPIDTLTSVKLANITQLDFSNCPIRSVNKGAFVYIPMVKILYMEFCNLSADSLPDGVFKPLTRLQILGLRFNPLGQVPRSLPVSLRGLDLVGTNLRFIPTAAFSSLINLDSLGLWQNPLERIDDGAFMGLAVLTLLDASQTQLRELSNMTLVGLPGMTKLYLSISKIASVDPAAFDWFRRPQQYWLSGNQLTTLDVAMKKAFTLPSVNFIDVTFNPLVCDCRLRWLKELQEAPGSVVQAPHLIQCAGPVRLKARAWDTLSAKQFIC